MHLIEKLEINLVHPYRKSSEKCCEIAVTVGVQHSTIGALTLTIGVPISTIGVQFVMDPVFWIPMTFDLWIIVKTVRVLFLTIGALLLTIGAQIAPKIILTMI